MRRATPLLALLMAVLATACANLPQVRPGEMVLDTERQLLCLHAEIQCRSLGLIIANSDRDQVLKAYGQPPWDWDQLDTVSELTTLLLEPPKAPYSVERLTDSRYRLPVNERTYTVWRVLDEEYRGRYCEPGEFSC